MAQQILIQMKLKLNLNSFDFDDDSDRESCCGVASVRVEAIQERRSWA